MWIRILNKKYNSGHLQKTTQNEQNYMYNIYSSYHKIFRVIVEDSGLVFAGPGICCVSDE